MRNGIPESTGADRVLAANRTWGGSGRIRQVLTVLGTLAAFVALALAGQPVPPSPALSAGIDVPRIPPTAAFFPAVWAPTPGWSWQNPPDRPTLLRLGRILRQAEQVSSGGNYPFFLAGVALEVGYPDGRTLFLFAAYQRPPGGEVLSLREGRQVVQVQSPALQAWIRTALNRLPTGPALTAAVTGHRISLRGFSWPGQGVTVYLVPVTDSTVPPTLHPPGAFPIVRFPPGYPVRWSGEVAPPRGWRPPRQAKGWELVEEIGPFAGFRSLGQTEGWTVVHLPAGFQPPAK